MYACLFGNILSLSGCQTEAYRRVGISAKVLTLFGDVTFCPAAAVTGKIIRQLDNGKLYGRWRFSVR